VPGVCEALRKRRADVAAVCPLVGGKSLKGPSDRMMAELGYETSAVGVASLYRDICATFVIDETDEAASTGIEALDMRPVVRPTVMRSVEDKERLARHVLALFAR
jgi:LPPG:FO 2-phospho-L-lactate transferase